MALETGNYINDLVVTNPLGTDPKSAGDDHIRLLKNALKNSFAGFAGIVLSTGVEAQGATVNDYTVTLSPAPAAYTTSMLVLFKATHANTGAATLQINGLGSKTLQTVDGQALVSGLIANGEACLAWYDGTNFLLISAGGMLYAPTPSVGDASTRIATTAFVAAQAFSAILPGQTGNAGKYLTTDGTNASWASLSITGSGGATLTTSTTLTSSSAGAMRAAMPSPGHYITLPSALTLSKGAVLYSVTNTGGYDVGIKDSAGTTLGWVRPNTGAIVGLADNTTAAGQWTQYGLNKIGTTAKLTTSALGMASPITLTIDADRTLVIFGSSSAIYGVIWNATTKAWGTVTSLRAAGSTSRAAILSAANQVLLVSVNTGGTAMEAVTLTLSGTSITVNTAATATLGSAVVASNINQLIAVGSSWVFAYRRTPSTNTDQMIRALTISGTTVTIGAETTVLADADDSLFMTASGSVLRTVVQGNNGTIAAKPFTISGTTITAGTQATVSGAGSGLNSNLGKILLNGNGNIVAAYYSASATTAVTVFKLTGTTEAASTVTAHTANPFNTRIALSPISASKMLLSVHDVSSNLYANIITDTAGTASAGTALALQNGNSLRYHTIAQVIGNTGVVIAHSNSNTGIGYSFTLDCSGSSPTLIKSDNWVLQGWYNTSTASYTATVQPPDYLSTAYIGTLQAGSTTYLLGLASNSNNTAHSDLAVTAGGNQVLPAAVYPGAYIVNGPTASECWGTGSIDGNRVITRIEVAA